MSIMSLALRASRTSLSSMLARPATVYGSPVFGRHFHQPYDVPGNGPIDPGPVQDPNEYDILVSDVNGPKLLVVAVVAMRAVPPGTFHPLFCGISVIGLFKKAADIATGQNANATDLVTLMPLSWQ
jgi:hypothetical protein